MQQQINTLAEKVAALTALQKANHEENRRDIHRLNNANQTLLDSLAEGLDKIASKIDQRLSPVEGAVHELQIAWAKATGYILALSAVAGVVFAMASEAVRSAIAHFLLH